MSFVWRQYHTVAQVSLEPMTVLLSLSPWNLTAMSHHARLMAIFWVLSALMEREGRERSKGVRDESLVLSVALATPPALVLLQGPAKPPSLVGLELLPGELDEDLQAKETASGEGLEVGMCLALFWVIVPVWWVESSVRSQWVSCPCLVWLSGFLLSTEWAVFENEWCDVRWAVFENEWCDIRGGYTREWSCDLPGILPHLPCGYNGEIQSPPPCQIRSLDSLLASEALPPTSHLEFNSTRLPWLSPSPSVWPAHSLLVYFIVFWALTVRTCVWRKHSTTELVSLRQSLPV